MEREKRRKEGERDEEVFTAFVAGTIEEVEERGGRVEEDGRMFFLLVGWLMLSFLKEGVKAEGYGR